MHRLGNYQALHTIFNREEGRVALSTNTNESLFASSKDTNKSSFATSTMTNKNLFAFVLRAYVATYSSAGIESLQSASNDQPIVQQQRLEHLAHALECFNVNQFLASVHVEPTLPQFFSKVGKHTYDAELGYQLMLTAFELNQYQTVVDLGTKLLTLTCDYLSSNEIQSKVASSHAFLNCFSEALEGFKKLDIQTEREHLDFGITLQQLGVGHALTHLEQLVDSDLVKSTVHRQRFLFSYAHALAVAGAHQEVIAVTTTYLTEFAEDELVVGKGKEEVTEEQQAGASDVSASNLSESMHVLRCRAQLACENFTDAASDLPQSWATSKPQFARALGRRFVSDNDEIVTYHYLPESNEIVLVDTAFYRKLDQGDNFTVEHTKIQTSYKNIKSYKNDIFYLLNQGECLVGMVPDRGNGYYARPWRFNSSNLSASVSQHNIYGSISYESHAGIGFVGGSRVTLCTTNNSGVFTMSTCNASSGDNFIACAFGNDSWYVIVRREETMNLVKVNSQNNINNSAVLNPNRQTLQDDASRLESVRSGYYAGRLVIMTETALYLPTVESLDSDDDLRFEFAADGLQLPFAVNEIKHVTSDRHGAIYLVTHDARVYNVSLQQPVYTMPLLNDEFFDIHYDADNSVTTLCHKNGELVQYHHCQHAQLRDAMVILFHAQSPDYAAIVDILSGQSLLGADLQRILGLSQFELAQHADALHTLSGVLEAFADDPRLMHALAISSTDVNSTGYFERLFAMADITAKVPADRIASAYKECALRYMDKKDYLAACKMWLGYCDLMPDDFTASVVYAHCVVQSPAYCGKKLDSSTVTKLTSVFLSNTELVLADLALQPENVITLLSNCLRQELSFEGYRQLTSADILFDRARCYFLMADYAKAAVDIEALRSVYSSVYRNDSDLLLSMLIEARSHLDQHEGVVDAALMLVGLEDDFASSSETQGHTETIDLTAIDFSDLALGSPLKLCLARALSYLSGREHLSATIYHGVLTNKETAMLFTQTTEDSYRFLDVLHRLSQHREFLVASEQLSEYFEPTSQTLFQLGHAQLHEHRLEEAEASLSQSIVLGASSASVFYDMALLAITTNNLMMAMRYLDRCVRCAEDLVDVYSARALASYRLGEFDDSVTNYELAVSAGAKLDEYQQIHYLRSLRLTQKYHKAADQFQALSQVLTGSELLQTVPTQDSTKTCIDSGYVIMSDGGGSNVIRVTDPSTQEQTIIPLQGVPSAAIVNDLRILDASSSPRLACLHVHSESRSSYGGYGRNRRAYPYNVNITTYQEYDLVESARTSSVVFPDNIQADVITGANYASSSSELRSQEHNFTFSTGLTDRASTTVLSSEIAGDQCVIILDDEDQSELLAWNLNDKEDLSRENASFSLQIARFSRLTQMNNKLLVCSADAMLQVDLLSGDVLQNVPLGYDGMTIVSNVCELEHGDMAAVFRDGGLLHLMLVNRHDNAPVVTIDISQESELIAVQVWDRSGEIAIQLTDRVHVVDIKQEMILKEGINLAAQSLQAFIPLTNYIYSQTDLPPNWANVSKVLYDDLARCQAASIYFDNLRYCSFVASAYRRHYGGVLQFTDANEADVTLVEVRAHAAWQLQVGRARVSNSQRSLIEESIASLDVVITDETEQASLFYLRGQLKKLLNPADAAEDFAKAEELGFVDANLSYDSGIASYEQHDYETAISDFDSFLSQEPARMDARYYRGLSHYHLGSVDHLNAAIEDLSACIDSESDFPDLRLYRLKAFYELLLTSTQMTEARRLSSLDMMVRDGQSLEDLDVLAVYAATQHPAHYQLAVEQLTQMINSDYKPELLLARARCNISANNSKAAQADYETLFTDMRIINGVQARAVAFGQMAAAMGIINGVQGHAIAFGQMAAASSLRYPLPFNGLTVSTSDYVNFAGLLYMAGEYAACIQLLDVLFADADRYLNDATDAQRSQLHLSYAKSSYFTEEYTAAGRHFELSYSLDSNILDDSCVEKWATSNVYLSEWQSVIDCYNLPNVSLEGHSCFVNLSMAHFYLGDYKRAVTHLNFCLEQPVEHELLSHLQTVVMLAICDYYLGESDANHVANDADIVNALSTRITELADDAINLLVPRAHLVLALVLSRLGNFVDAHNHYDSYISLPNVDTDFDIHLQAAECALEVGLYDVATDHVTTVPDGFSSRTHYLFAVAAQMRLDNQAAIDSYTHYLAESPNDHNARARRAIVGSVFASDTHDAAISALLVEDVSILLDLMLSEGIATMDLGFGNHITLNDCYRIRGLAHFWIASSVDGANNVSLQLALDDLRTLFRELPGEDTQVRAELLGITTEICMRLENSTEAYEYLSTSLGLSAITNFERIHELRVEVAVKIADSALIIEATSAAIAQYPYSDQALTWIELKGQHGFELRSMDDAYSKMAHTDLTSLCESLLENNLLLDNSSNNSARFISAIEMLIELSKSFKSKSMRERNLGNVKSLADRALDLDSLNEDYSRLLDHIDLLLSEPAGSSVQATSSSQSVGSDADVEQLRQVMDPDMYAAFQAFMESRGT